MEYSSRFEYIFLYEYTHYNTICMEVSVVVEYFCLGTVYKYMYMVISYNITSWYHITTSIKIVKTII